MDPVDRLYECYEILANAKDSIAEHESEYVHILDAVKGGPKEKTLASQFIPKFVKDFPHHAETAQERMFDLVEDEDVSIRKQAIKNLPTICKDLADYTSKIADILTQLLICEDASEISIVHTALITILKMDVKGALTGIFSQIGTTDEEIVRKRAITYICTKLKFLPSELVTRDVEEFIMKECKQIFAKVSGEEFSTLMGMLANLKMAKSIPGQKALVETVLEQIELDKEFCGKLPDVLCLIQCIRSALPFLSSFTSSAPLVKYICSNVFPFFKDLATLDSSVDFSLELMKLLAEISPFCHSIEDCESGLQVVSASLLEFIPLPPAESLEGDALALEPNFQYTQIECLMYTFYQLAKKNKEYLTQEKNAEFFKDFKLRLNYLARVNQGAIKKIQESLINSKKDKTDSLEENKIKAVALITMSNINALIKDLFHTPPSFKATITLSWKPVAKPESQPERKRREEITFDDEDSKRIKKDWKGPRQLYTPPSGKYSSNVKFGRFNSPRYYRGGRGRGTHYY